MNAQQCRGECWHPDCLRGPFKPTLYMPLRIQQPAAIQRGLFAHATIPGENTMTLTVTRAATHVWFHDHASCSDAPIGMSGDATCDYCDAPSSHRVGRSNNLHIRTLCDPCLNQWATEGSADFFNSGENEPISEVNAA